MSMPVEDRKKLVKAKLEEAAAKKKAAKMPPVQKLPYDPENMYLSKKDFVAKQNKKKADEAAAKEFIAKRNSAEEELPSEDAAVETPKKGGRPKKVE